MLLLDSVKGTKWSYHQMEGYDVKQLGCEHCCHSVKMFMNLVQNNANCIRTKQQINLINIIEKHNNWHEKEFKHNNLLKNCSKCHWLTLNQLVNANSILWPRLLELNSKKLS